MANTVRILLADDHQMVRMGLKMMIEAVDGFECIGEYDNATDAISALDTALPDVILLDIFMPGINGINAVKEILAKNQNAKILLMTAFVDQNLTHQAAECGAMGLFEKNISPEDFQLAVWAVVKGKLWYDRAVLKLISKGQPITTPSFEHLNFSEREKKIGKLLMEGKTNNQIAHELGLSVNTIKKDLSHLYAWMKVASRAEATALLSRSNLS